MGLENQLETPSAIGFFLQIGFFLRHPQYIHFQVSVYLEEMNRKILFCLVVGKLRKGNHFAAEMYSLTGLKGADLDLVLRTAFPASSVLHCNLGPQDFMGFSRLECREPRNVWNKTSLLQLKW